MGKIIRAESSLDPEMDELICLKCLRRWIGVYPVMTPLRNIKCRCGAVGYVIKTGQTIAMEVEVES